MDTGYPAMQASLLDSTSALGIQPFLCLHSAYAMMCCCRQAEAQVQDVSLYEFSGRRRLLIMQIPSYIAFRLRTAAEVELQSALLQQANVPPIPPWMLKQAADTDLSLSDILHLPLVATDSDHETQPQKNPSASACTMRAMQQAKFTSMFAQGIHEYEKKNWQVSEEKLREALAMVPEDDIILSRLGDTCFGKMQAIKRGNETGDAQEWEAKTLQLYQQALKVNPRSSYGYNGLSLFQKTSIGKTKCLLQAVALDHENSYALINLAIEMSHRMETTTTSTEECLQLAQRAVAINPKLFFARSTIATFLIKLGRYKEALNVMKEQLSHRPNDTDARRFHDDLESALDRVTAANTVDDEASDSDSLHTLTQGSDSDSQ